MSPDRRTSGRRSRLELRDVAPEILEAVVLARLGREDVQDDVEVVGDDPARLALAVDERGGSFASCFSAACTSS